MNAFSHIVDARLRRYHHIVEASRGRRSPSPAELLDSWFHPSYNIHGTQDALFRLSPYYHRFRHLTAEWDYMEKGASGCFLAD